MRTLRWGLGRYRILLVLCALLMTVGLPAYAASQPSHYDSEALVVADTLKIQLVALPRYGQAVFNNGAVARRVAETFVGNGGPAAVVPLRVSVTTPQDSLIFHVVGHDTDPKRAAGIADLAAAVFTKQLNASGPGVGSFTVQANASTPKQTAVRLRALPYQRAVGLLAGLALGLSIVAFILVVRQPVIGAEDAVEVGGTPVFGTVVMRRRPRWKRATVEGAVGLVPLCRRLIGVGATRVLVVGPPRRQIETQRIIAAMSAILDQADLPRPLTIVDDVYLPDWLADPATTATLLVVFQGSSAASVRAVVTDYAAASLAGLVFVRTRGPRLRQWAVGASRTGLRGG
jgi:capsular polysaccharide biosynthesis protein